MTWDADTRPQPVLPYQIQEAALDTRIRAVSRPRRAWIFWAVLAVLVALAVFGAAIAAIAVAVSWHPQAATAVRDPRPAASPAPVRTVVKWKTRTVTKTVQTPAPPAGVTCWPYNGQAFLASPGAGIPAVSGCTITVTPVYPLSSGEVTITVTAPGGESSVLTAAS